MKAWDVAYMQRRVTPTAGRRHRFITASPPFPRFPPRAVATNEYGLLTQADSKSMKLAQNQFEIPQWVNKSGGGAF